MMIAFVIVLLLAFQIASRSSHISDHFQDRFNDYMSQFPSYYIFVRSILAMLFISALVRHYPPFDILACLAVFLWGLNSMRQHLIGPNRPEVILFGRLLNRFRGS